VTVVAAVSGPVRFARFALPPNQLGYCGPGDDGSLAHYASTGEDPGLRSLAAGFDGAYPYLQLLAGENRRGDPLDPDVVEAYWIGNELLRNVSVFQFGRSIDDRFRRRAGADWRHVDTAIVGGVPHHAFHVMHVMPWTGLLRDGIIDEPLRIVDRCRVSWATVIDRPDARGDDGGTRALIRRVPLVWRSDRLEYGEPVVEHVSTSIAVEPGDVVAVHWDWICERLSVRQLAWLRTVTDEQLAMHRAR
jgi:hypothetical protein